MARQSVLRERVTVAGAGQRARERVVASLQAVTMAAVAAALAWYFAHRVLGHAQPFFAPIAAAISLSTSQVQRSRRTAQMIAGVLLGIVIGDGMHSLLGGSTVALGVIVFATMVIALVAGVGFFGDGMMFPNQAAASAILVVTLHHHGTGPERALDAVVGGGAALLVGVLLFPAEPLHLLADAEQGVLETLAGRLTHVVALLGQGRAPSAEWTLDAGHEIHHKLSALARARSTARVNVRVAPRRWRLRRLVDAEERRTSQLDLLSNAVLSLLRSLTTSVALEAPPGPELEGQVQELAGTLDQLARSPRPWPGDVIAHAQAAAQAALHYTDQRGIDREHVVAAILRATARDLLAVVNRSD
jgi:uncharacterized membrane protein YgaE (UPF0421/DUF939 family)